MDEGEGEGDDEGGRGVNDSVRGHLVMVLTMVRTLAMGVQIMNHGPERSLSRA
jgi:hypothetical protein